MIFWNRHIMGFGAATENQLGLFDSGLLRFVWCRVFKTQPRHGHYIRPGHPERRFIRRLHWLIQTGQCFPWDGRRKGKQPGVYQKADRHARDEPAVHE